MRHTSKRPRKAYFLSAGIVMIGILTVGTISYASSASDSKDDAALIGSVNTCFPLSTSGERTCLEAIVQPLLSHMSAGDIMGEMQKRLDHLQCHRTGHVIGIELFKKYGSIYPALEQCTAACTSGCIHGVIYQEMFSTFGTDDIDTVNLDELMSRGVEACDIGIHACHGVGHILFNLYKSYVPALEYCEKFSTVGQRDMCQNGVFMQSYPAMRSGDVASATLSTYAQPDDLLYPCHALPSKYFKPCYRLVYLNQWAIFDALGLDDYTVRADKTFEACLSLPPGEERQACLIGGGQQIARTSALADPTSYCRNLDLVEDRRNCGSGFAMASVNYGRPAQAWGYCAVVPADEKNACYYGLFAGTLVPDSNLSASAACSGTVDDACPAALEVYDKVYRKEYLGMGL